jgi:hypothetical protein
MCLKRKFYEEYMSLLRAESTGGVSSTRKSTTSLVAIKVARL